MRTGLRRASVAMMAVAVLTAGMSGCRGDAAGGGAAPPPAATSDAQIDAPAPTRPPEVVAEGFGRAPRPTRTPTPAATAKRGTTATVLPRASRRPPAETKLPPAVPVPSSSDCRPRYVGMQATRDEAKAALTDAAGRTYWPVSAPSIRVPLTMVKAVAWQESGWQSNIVACDGGIGLMQVMPATADYINQRFEQNYDVNRHTDNAVLGANYLAWLIKYFGDVYFNGDYTLTSTGDCASHTAPCLINAVLAAYNYGFGRVDTAEGLVIPNPRYVQNVRALMTECTCLTF